MRSVIIPLVKSKSGDLADFNNYRAIAISTSMSKLFECVIAGEVCSYSEYDKYQFGFKSTGLCTNILKNTVDYYMIISLAEALFLHVLILLISPRRSIE